MFKNYQIRCSEWSSRILNFRKKYWKLTNHCRQQQISRLFPFFIIVVCTFHIFLRRTCITFITGGWEKGKLFCFYKGRELVKDGKELASLFFTAPVSTCDEKRSNLLLGHFYASETWECFLKEGWEGKKVKEGCEGKIVKSHIARQAMCINIKSSMGSTIVWGM